MNFKKQQEIINEYINENYLKYLMEYNIPNKPIITNDYIDFDRFKNNFICFIEFDTSNFPITYKDDCSLTENLIVNFYLTHRNNTPELLNELMLDSTSAFFNMIRENQVKNVIEQKINKIDFFKYIEGKNNIFCSKIVLELNIEV